MTPNYSVYFGLMGKRFLSEKCCGLYWNEGYSLDLVLTSSSDENESSEDDYNDSLSQDCDDESDLGDNDDDGLGAQLETGK